MWLKKIGKENETVPSQAIPVDKLYIDFSDALSDFFIRLPGDPTSYIVYIGDYQLGFGDRWLLKQKLNKIQERYPYGIYETDIKTRPIPQLTTPLQRLRGSKKRSPTEKIEEKIDEQRKRFWLRPTIPYGWTLGSGTTTEKAYQAVNRPEERWWY